MDYDILESIGVIYYNLRVIITYFSLYGLL